MLVYDPIAPTCGQNVAGWRGLVLNDWERFSRSFWASRGCFVVIDEAAEVSQVDRPGLRRMLTRGRHVDPASGGGGHCVMLLSQRHLLLDRSARAQCSTLFAFQVGQKDADDLAEEWSCPELRTAVPALPQYHYIHLERYGRPKRGTVRR